MNKIRIIELFASLQGELSYIGIPSVFLRTYGCNFRCRGFGMPEGQLSTEADDIAKLVNTYKSIEDIPVPATGCDSPISWHPGFKKFTTDYTAQELAKELVNLIPSKNWIDPATNTNTHLVITGGEPLLGWQKFYPELLSTPLMTDLRYLTFETNATQSINAEFATFLKNWQLSNNREVLFSCSVKLKASGEPADKAIKPETVLQYQSIGKAALKLVTDGSDEQLFEINRVVSTFKNAGFTGLIYLMPVGGTYDVYRENATKVANICLKMGYNYSPREQNFLWSNSWGT